MLETGRRPAPLVVVNDRRHLHPLPRLLPRQIVVKILRAARKRRIVFADVKNSQPPPPSDQSNDSPALDGVMAGGGAAGPLSGAGLPVTTRR